MKELSTVKQLKEFLDGFSDNCEVNIVINGLPHKIAEYGWSSGGEEEPGTSVELSMRHATELDFFVEKTSENPCEV